MHFSRPFFSLYLLFLSGLGPRQSRLARCAALLVLSFPDSEAHVSNQSRGGKTACKHRHTEKVRGICVARQHALRASILSGHPTARLGKRGKKSRPIVSHTCQCGANIFFSLLLFLPRHCARCRSGANVVRPRRPLSLSLVILYCRGKARVKVFVCRPLGHMIFPFDCISSNSVKKEEKNRTAKRAAPLGRRREKRGAIKQVARREWCGGGPHRASAAQW
nr:hypothetical protein [Pandoravirus massiliensis]